MRIRPRPRQLPWVQIPAPKQCFRFLLSAFPTRCCGPLDLYKSAEAQGWQPGRTRVQAHCLPDRHSGLRAEPIDTTNTTQLLYDILSGVERSRGGAEETPPSSNVCVYGRGRLFLSFLLSYSVYF